MSLAEILPSVRSLSAADKLHLIRLLAEQVDLGTDIAPLEHGRTYVVSTPIFEPGAAEILLRELEAASRFPTFCLSEMLPLNPKGIPTQSPGLRGTSYPG